MPTVTMLKCSVCKLRWIEEPDQHRCPRCQRFHRIQPKAVVAGVEVEVKRIELWGGVDGLLDEDVRRGLSGLVLPGRCPHRMISRHICNLCATNK